MKKIHKILSLSFLFFLFCTKKNENVEQPKPSPSLEQAFSNLRLEVNSASLVFFLDGESKDLTLDCMVDDKAIDPIECKNRTINIKNFSSGEHKLIIKAKKQNQLVQEKEKSFSITNSSPTPSSSASDPLKLELNNPNFKSGMPMDIFISDPFLKIDFKLISNNSTCDVKDIITECSFGGPDLWQSCTSQFQHQIPKELLAYEKQTFKARASCKGTDKIGETLQFDFYGVAKDYQELSLRRIEEIKSKRSILTLYRDLDCPNANQLIILGSNPTDQSFVPLRDNVIDNPPKGYRVFARCGAKDGPLLLLN